MEQTTMIIYVHVHTGSSLTGGTRVYRVYTIAEAQEYVRRAEAQGCTATIVTA